MTILSGHGRATVTRASSAIAITAAHSRHQKGRRSGRKWAQVLGVVVAGVSTVRLAEQARDIAGSGAPAHAARPARGRWPAWCGTPSRDRTGAPDERGF